MASLRPVRATATSPHAPGCRLKAAFHGKRKTAFRRPGPLRTVVFSALLALPLTNSLQTFTARSEQPSTSEYQVEAAYLYHFAEFVAWPPGAFSGPDAPLTIGLLDGEELGADLEAIIRNKSAQGRPLRIVRLDSKGLSEARKCHILFIGPGQRKRLPEILKAIQGAPILSVSRMEGFTEAGGIINFTIDDKKVRFEINDNAARQVDLKISAKLLNLARRKAAYLTRLRAICMRRSTPHGMPGTPSNGRTLLNTWLQRGGGRATASEYRVNSSQIRAFVRAVSLYLKLLKPPSSHST